MGLDVVILAAGKGTRMKSALPKVLHKVAGIAMLERVLRASRALEPGRIVCVVGDMVELFDHTFGAPGDVEWVVQRERLGTGHAVLQARGALEGSGARDVLVLNGDMPRITGETLSRILGAWREAGADAALVSTRLEDPTGYGRILRDRFERFRGIVEERDADETQRRIHEVSVGVYAARRTALLEALEKVGNDNDQGEYYLPDAFGIMLREGLRVEALPIEPAGEFEGVNDRVQLAEASRAVRERTTRRLMMSGVTFVDPATTYVSDTVEVGEDTLIEPGVVLEGQTVIGASCHIGAYSVVIDSVLDERVDVRPFSHIEGAEVARRAVVGPYTRLREGSRIGPRARVGNFVETKKALLEEGVKANHLAYLGDCHIGADSNIGAGTITCNYDGCNKHHTEIGEGVFVGSNSTLVAPVELEPGSYVGAGSVITRRVPEDSLAVGRARQVIKEGYAARIRERQAEAAAAVEPTPEEPEVG